MQALHLCKIQTYGLGQRIGNACQSSDRYRVLILFRHLEEKAYNRGFRCTVLEQPGMGDTKALKWTTFMRFLAMKRTQKRKGLIFQHQPDEEGGAPGFLELAGSFAPGLLGLAYFRKRQYQIQYLPIPSSGLLTRH